MDTKYNQSWRHPGRNASDYGNYPDHNHDRRTYASIGSFRGRGPKGYQKKDEKIKEEVCESLLWSPDVDASEIEVSVIEGCVYLEGFVDSRHAKKTAEALIEQISGVYDIHNQLILKKDLDLEEDKIIARGDEGLFSQEIIQK